MTDPAKSARVSLVGTGAIGLQMALQPQRADYTVTGIDVSDAVIGNAKADGIETVRTLGEAPRAEAVTVMVSTPEQLAARVDPVADQV